MATVFDNKKDTGSGESHAGILLSDWESPVLATEYFEFNAMIPSDRIGYDVVRYLSMGKKAILDLGCNAGNFTRELAMVNPEALVVGVDMNKAAIDAARSQKLTSKRLRFEHVERNGFIEELEGKFDTVILSFVDAVIPELDELTALLTNATRYLSPGGQLIIYRLNPEAIFAEGQDYHNYSGKQILENKLGGPVFRHTLTLPNGKSIELTDRAWDVSTINSILANLSMETVRSWNLSINISNGIGEVVRRGIRLFERVIGKSSKNEWGGNGGGALYQVMMTTKPRVKEIREA